jgi:hypothetical protein
MTTDLATRQPTHTYADLERMAVAIAKSGLFGVKTPEQALSLMLLAQAEGLHPAIAARDYHVIDGKPALKADAMLSRFMATGGRVEWHELTDAKVSATFSHSIGGTLRIEWTIEMAARAELTKKDNWRKYPRAMLRSRVVSEGIRSVYPGIITGVYTPDELQNGEPELRDITPCAEAKQAACNCGSPSGPHDPDCTALESPRLTRPRDALELIADAQVSPAAAAAPEVPRIGEGEIADHLAAIDAASTLTDLKKAHAVAYAVAYRLKDSSALARFTDAKERAKARLSRVGV